MNYIFYTIILLFSYSKQHTANEAAERSGDANGGESNVENFHDDQEYRIAAGEKYFASIGSNGNRDSWIDPYYMFDYEIPSVDEAKTSDSGSVKTLKLGHSESMEEKSGTVDTELHNQEFSATGSTKCATSSELWTRKCGQNEYVHIIRWLRKFLRKMNYSPDMDLNEMHVVQFSVNNRELHKIFQFLDSKTPNDVLDIEDVLDSLVTRFHMLDLQSASLRDVLDFIEDHSVFFFTLLLCLVSLWYFRMLYYKGLSLKLLTVLVCLASIIWTWVHMYQKEIAKKQATLHSLGYPQECEQSRLNFFSRLNLYVRKSLFELEDNCAKYYEAQIVDPFWKISPLMVVSETVSNFILQPLGSIASHSNIFLKNLFSGMPITMVIPTVFFAFILLLTLCRYKLRLPFFFGTLEPSLLANNADRIELLRYTSSELETSHDAPTVDTRSSARASPRRALQDLNKADFSGSGDCLQVASCNNMPQDQNVMRTLEVLKMSTETGLDDSFVDVETELKGAGDVLPNTSISSKASACSPSKMTLKDQPDR